tara:strand:+ start:594 stop:1058 length:465 start_codon:yes stop_codon:yes gene_type:complete
MSTYIVIGIILIIGIVAFSSWNSNKLGITKNRTELQSDEIRQGKRDLKLIITYDYGEKTEIITEKATAEIIKSTMKSIDWNEFHIVQLEDKNAVGYKALDVGGSLGDDGLASGLVTDDDHILLIKPLETVDQMTQILLDFLKGEEIWRNKYEYK